MWTGGSVPSRNRYGHKQLRTDPNCTGTVCTSTVPIQIWTGYLKGGGVMFLKHLHLIDYAELYSKISSRIILHDYLLACEISKDPRFKLLT